MKNSDVQTTSANPLNFKDIEKEVDKDDEELAQIYGYVKCDTNYEENEQQVDQDHNYHLGNRFYCRIVPPRCGFIKPIASKILTVFMD